MAARPTAWYATVLVRATPVRPSTVQTADYPAFVAWTLAELAARPLPGPALDHVLDGALHPDRGFLLEVGVWSGTTINRIAAHDPSRTVWGFDSFRGLPAAWRPGYPAGALDAGGRLPRVRPNVALVPGWFHDTLPRFAAEVLRHGTVSLLHVDCDLYASTATSLGALRAHVRPGTVLVFDELVNYPGYEAHELKALYEFCRDTGWGVEYLGCPGPPDHWARTGQDTALYQQVAARVV
jgi:hypothetical protein